MKRTRTALIDRTGGVSILGGLIVILALFAIFGLAGCSSGRALYDGAVRALGVTPGTMYNYGADGQVVYEAHCRSLDFQRDTEFDRYNAKGDKIEDSAVVQFSCGGNVIKTVGFTTVYVSDNAQAALFANSQQFAQIRLQNNDRGVPLVNFAWRAVKDKFTGTDRIAQVCDQNNNPIMAFAGSIVGFATDINKSTMFQIQYQKQTGYVLVSRGSYTLTDTALLN